MTARGPGGTRTFTRTFAGLRPHQAAGGPRARAAATISNRVASAIDDARQPKVFAIGMPSVLAGKTSGCGPMTVLSGSERMVGCLNPVDSMPDIPARERGVIDTLGRELRLDPADSDLMNEAVKQADGYIGTGRTLLNGTWPVVPAGAAKIVNFPQAEALFSSNAGFLVAGVRMGAGGGAMNFKLDPSKFEIPLGNLPKPPKFPSIGGFELVGDWDIDLQGGSARIKASLKLPKWITSAGIEVQNSVTLRATPDELKIEDVSIGPIKVNLGGLDVDGFRIAYTKGTDTWQGQGKACVLSGLCLDMVPPNGQVKIVHGQLSFAGASVRFPPPGVPLFAGVNLERLGFGVGLDPTRLTGNGRIAVLKLVKLDGRLVVAFPSARTPFVLRPDEVGDGFPAKLYQTVFTRPTLGATAAVIVSLPKLELELGHGYFLYQYPSYIAVGGGVKADLFDIVGFEGSISGEANFRDEVVNLHGDISACLLHPRICGDAAANVSRGPHNAGGAGACIGVLGFHVGGGIRWAHLDEPYIWPFDGCKWSRFKLDVSASRAQAAAPRTIVVKRGAPSPALKLYGRGGAPKVQVSGPGGQSLNSTDAGLDASPGGKIRILRSESPKTNFTVIGIQNGKPGIYTATPLPGSAPITKVQRATDLPNARVSGRVTGRGSRRVLHYRVLRRPGQQVRFFDIGEGGAAREIGHVTGGGTGTIPFSPAPGRKRRKVQAQFDLQGLPAERKVVASFRPPSLVLPAPRRLRAVRRGTRLTISWARVAGTTRYEAAITSPTGYQRVFSTRKTRIVLRRFAKATGGRISVRALDATRHSAVAAVRLKRAAAAPSRFRTPKRCTVGRKKITCRVA